VSKLKKITEDARERTHGGGDGTLDRTNTKGKRGEGREKNKTTLSKDICHRSRRASKIGANHKDRGGKERGGKVKRTVGKKKTSGKKTFNEKKRKEAQQGAKKNLLYQNRGASVCRDHRIKKGE